MRTSDATCPDAGSIVSSWLIKVVVAIGLVAVVIMDGVSVVSANIQLKDATVQAARDASAVRSSNKRVVVAAADASLASANADNVLVTRSVQVSPDGTVTLSAQRTAPTLVMHYIPRLRDYATVHATGSGKAV
ncbi:MAG: hypothetical protein CSA58_06550 [Micrococcales bacterium]|nr:MAG: hypothetical protein CSA58_06550 [Micrococcales bacterium]